MELPLYRRPQVDTIKQSIKRSPELLQIIIGPRQTGKTTAALQIRRDWKEDTIFASADTPLPPGPDWLIHHWNMARSAPNKPVLLIIDEVQKITGWSETVKNLWDKDRSIGSSLNVLLLGSSSLLIKEGLMESLAGRFYLHRLNHWNYTEVRDAFNYTLDEWLFFGGYPGTLKYSKDINFWASYVRDSLIETVISKDVLQMQKITKPSLLRHLFYLSTYYPAEILSYNKMLGQLTDAGNTTTLAHYVSILESAFLLSGLEQFKKGSKPKKGSSPKLILWNNALINASTMSNYKDTRNDHAKWGRLVENAVGSFFLNNLGSLPYHLYYWRKGNVEVDFVLASPGKIIAVEVKSSRMRKPMRLKRFLELYPSARQLIIGEGRIELEEFFSSSLEDILERYA